MCSYWSIDQSAFVFRFTKTAIRIEWTTEFVVPRRRNKLLDESDVCSRIGLFAGGF
jgi:hypothetical protein